MRRSDLYILEVIGSDVCIWLGSKNNQIDEKGISWLHAKTMKIRYLIDGKKVTNIMASNIASFGL